MDIEYVPIKNLLPYSWNNKLHTQSQIERIANSIAQFGFNQPIVVDEKNIILVGHGRFEAAKRLGLETVPILKKLDLNEAQKKAYRIIDNKTASDTSFDMGNLELEVKALEEMGFDTEPFAFDEFKFVPPEPPAEDEQDEEDPGENIWVGQIKLKVPADIIDHFEPELNDLLKKYEGIKKETKRSK